jgi:hypothetical protein
MHQRSPIEELRSIEGVNADQSALSATMVKLIHASRELEAKVYDSDARSGMYVVVLEGILEGGDREGLVADPHGTSGERTGERT